MKKILALVLALVLVLSAAAALAGGDPETTEPETTEEVTKVPSPAVAPEPEIIPPIPPVGPIGPVDNTDYSKWNTGSSSGAAEMLIGKINLTDKGEAILKALEEAKEAGDVSVVFTGLTVAADATVAEVMSISGDASLADMDAYTIDLTGVAGVKAGDEVAVLVNVVDAEDEETWYEADEATAPVDNTVRVTLKADVLKAIAAAKDITFVVVNLSAEEAK